MSFSSLSEFVLDLFLGLIEGVFSSEERSCSQAFSSGVLYGCLRGLFICCRDALKRDLFHWPTYPTLGLTDLASQLPLFTQLLG